MCVWIVGVVSFPAQTLSLAPIACAYTLADLIGAGARIWLARPQASLVWVRSSNLNFAYPDEGRPEMRVWLETRG